MADRHPDLRLVHPSPAREGQVRLPARRFATGPRAHQHPYMDERRREERGEAIALGVICVAAVAVIALVLWSPELWHKGAVAGWVRP